MSLLSTDISKVKRLSLREISLPTTERSKELIIPKKVDKTPSDEVINYNKLIGINPLVEDLVDSLGLVSRSTGERIDRVKKKEAIKPHPEPKVKAKEIDKTKLEALTQEVIEVENSYTKQTIIERIKEAKQVTQERAEKGFNLILKAGLIKATPGNMFYYLKGSTPF